jgi:hypothetical protein
MISASRPRAAAVVTSRAKAPAEPRAGLTARGQRTLSFIEARGARGRTMIRQATCCCGKCLICVRKVTLGSAQRLDGVSHSKAFPVVDRSTRERAKPSGSPPTRIGPHCYRSKTAYRGGCRQSTRPRCRSDPAGRRPISKTRLSRSGAQNHLCCAFSPLIT